PPTLSLAVVVRLNLRSVRRRARSRGPARSRRRRRSEPRPRGAPHPGEALGPEFGSPGTRLAWHPAHSGPGWSSCRITRDPARPESRSPGSVVSVVVLAQPGQPGAAVGGADAAPDLVDDAAAGQVGGEQAGALDAAGAAGAVRDDDGAVQAEQHRAAVALAVQPVAELAQRLALQDRKSTRLNSSHV